MAEPIHPEFAPISLDELTRFEGAVAITAGPQGELNAPTRRLDRITQGIVTRFVSSEPHSKLKPGDCHIIAPPPGLSAESLVVCKVDSRPTPNDVRKAGARIAKAAGKKSLLLVPGAYVDPAEMAFGAVLRRYRFDRYKTDPTKETGELRVMTSAPEKADARYRDKRAAAEGVYLTRDLVNEPANVIGTVAFADRLRELTSIGLDVSILDETRMEELGMRALLGVGQGSESPSFLVTLEWKGGGDEAPLAVVGKGVVFDTGGISIKPAANMEEMTTDMGGAAVVAGLMKTLAMRRARANVVGVVGLVENMPDGRAQRPGDIVKSMKGDTIEVINTDAEGRLVLADALWYTQERFSPAGIIDLATLTGAIIIGLGHEAAGVFSNDDGFCKAFLDSAKTETEGAWRMPVGGGYEKLIKSGKADIKNTGGRPAGSITAAQFLLRFIGKETPWIHLDIAGVNNLKTDSDFAPKGATGWGVLTIDRLVRQRFESGADD
ncbi:MAG: leucyl aminopeptidase [Paracoccaceae bacterium]|nr:leucyl aminopeptidase [Paracoccaceae bacterium]